MRRIDDGGRQSAGKRHGWRRIGSLLVALTLVVAAPAGAQEADASRTRRRSDAERSGRDLPPTRVTKGPALPAPMVSALRHSVLRAVVESRRPGTTAEGNQAPAGQGHLTCELRDLSIELESRDFPGSSIAATVTGFAQSFTQAPAGGSRGSRLSAGSRTGTGAGSGGTPGPTIAFALLYVHPAPAAQDVAVVSESTLGPRWQLSLARFRPEASASAPEWHELWSDGPNRLPSPHPCLVEDVWRRVGRR